MKFYKIIILVSLIFVFLPLGGCKPSREDFFELKKKQLELEQRVNALEKGNSIQKLPEYTGEILDLDPFIVNLSDPGGNRYIKLKLAIELDSKDLLTKAKQLTPELRDQVISILTKLSVNDVMTPESKLKLRDELVEKINEVIKPSNINNLYFTDIVIQ